MIIPGILEKTFEEIKKKVALVDKATDLIQIDVADGELVDGRSFLSAKRLDEIKTDATFDLHLMVQNPLDFLRSKIKKVSKISAHVEADHIPEFLVRAKEFGYKIGLSINPKTPNKKIRPFTQNLDFVQFMAINPGAQGRKFKKEVLEKIKDFRQKHPNLKIQVDGGVSNKHIKEVVGAGADDIVIGSTIFNSDDPVQTLEKLQGQVEEYE